jgi:RHS repeat-associated protein
VFSIGYDFHVGNGTSGADNGNVWGITNYKDPSRNQTFTYDALNRLTSAQNAGTNCASNTVNGKTEYWGNSYGYDAWGNLLNKSVTKCSAENFSVAALANNQLSGYAYDAAGNMTHDLTSGLTYTFDQENRITGASGYAYTYDGDGNRVMKSNGSTGTLYWYMSPGIVGESDLSGNLTAEYVFFDGERVARKDSPSNAVSYYFSDHLKTASVVTDSLGNIKSESDFYPWGGELQFVNNDSNHYKYGGHERDGEIGLDYQGARYYSNGLGRFVSSDWSAVPVPVPYADFSNPQSLNLYRYPSNPETYADPDGHCDWCQSLKNFVTFNGWNTDDELKQKEQEYDKSVRTWLVNQYGLNPKDVAQLTPKQADKLSDALDAGKGGVTVDGVKIVVQAAAQAAAVVPTMLGANGTQVTSKTLWNGDKGRIDVENPNPGQRPGQIHYQDGSGKYIYDVAKGEFQGLSKTQNGQLLSKSEVQQAIQKGLKYLGVGQ